MSEKNTDLCILNIKHNFITWITIQGLNLIALKIWNVNNLKKAICNVK